MCVCVCVMCNLFSFMLMLAPPRNVCVCMCVCVCVCVRHVQPLVFHVDVGASAQEPRDDVPMPRCTRSVQRCLPQLRPGKANFMQSRHPRCLACEGRRRICSAVLVLVRSPLCAVLEAAGCSGACRGVYLISAVDVCSLPQQAINFAHQRLFSGPEQSTLHLWHAASERLAQTRRSGAQGAYLVPLARCGPKLVVQGLDSIFLPG